MSTESFPNLTYKLYTFANVEFAKERLGDILTVYSIHLGELDERFMIKVDDVSFDPSVDKFMTECSIYKVLEN